MWNQGPVFYNYIFILHRCDVIFTILIQDFTIAIHILLD